MKFLIAILTFISLNLFADELKKETKLVFKDSTIPYLKSYKKLAVLNSYNNELTKIFNTLRCNIKQRRNPKTFWDNFARIAYQKNEIISIKIRSNYNCDGVHPFEDVDHSLTYDLENNRVVTLFDIFLKNEDTYDLIRSGFYKSIKDANCKDKVNFYLESEKLFKEYLAFYMDKKEIVFKLKLPYGLRFCVKDLKVSYKDVMEKSSYVGVLKRLEAEFKKKTEK